MEAPLYSTSIKVERKHITLELRENPQGRFLRITEEVNGRRDAIIVPSSGLDELREALNSVVEHNQTLPPPPPSE